MARNGVKTLILGPEFVSEILGVTVTLTED